MVQVNHVQVQVESCENNFDDTGSNGSRVARALVAL